MTTYNGWTNYATWKINLEAVDHDYYRDFGYEDSHNLAEFIEAEVTEYLLEDANNAQASIITSFLSDVDWWEIADSIINEG